MRTTRRTALRSGGRRVTVLAATTICLLATSLSGGVALAAPPGTAPDTTITSAPTNPSASTTATFAFTSQGGGGATFTCKVDSGAAASCTSPKTYSGLAAGSHDAQEASLELERLEYLVEGPVQHLAQVERLAGGGDHVV